MEEMIQEFLSVSSYYGSGYGSGSGSGSGYGYGSGCGYGDGDGSGYGYGSGSGSGSDSGSGYGSGYGYGSGSGYVDGSGHGYGYGYVSGSGNGYGSGSGYGYDGLIGAIINSFKIYNIDDIATIIYRVSGNCAKGAIVNDDLTLTPCYIIKSGNVFAHGSTLHKAREALDDKLFDNMPTEDRVKAFTEKFKPDTAYSNQLFFDWHHKLTGSCEMGRNQFAKEHGIDLNSEMTVNEFISLTENAYGRNIIKMLKPYYKKDGGEAQ